MGFFTFGTFDSLFQSRLAHFQILQGFGVFLCIWRGPPFSGGKRVLSARTTGFFQVKVAYGVGAPDRLHCAPVLRSEKCRQGVVHCYEFDDVGVAGDEDGRN